jgi:hypothetical protein
MEIIVPNITLMMDFISSINKIVPSCEFNVSSEKTTVYGTTENDTLKPIMETNSMKSADKPFSFCFQELGKLVKVLNMVRNSEESESITIGFNKTFLTYDNVASFKVKVQKMDLIQMFIGQPLRYESTKVFSFIAEQSVLKNIIQQINVISTTESKAYISLKDGKVLCEIADRNNPMADSIGMPLSDTIEGTMDETIIMTLDVFRVINFMNAPIIEFTYNQNCNGSRFVSMNSQITENETYVKSQLIYRPVKV